MKARIMWVLLLLSQVLAGTYFAAAAISLAVLHHEVVGTVSCALLLVVAADNASWCVRRIRDRSEE